MTLQTKQYRRAKARHSLVNAVEAMERRTLFSTPTAFTGTYTQDFDGLNSQTSTIAVGAKDVNYDLESVNPSLAGWQVARAGGTGTSINLIKDTGTTNSGALYNYGSSGSSERALGSVGSGSNFGRYGLLLTNNSSGAIGEFTLSFTEEQWRVGGTSAELLTFGYKVGATGISDATGWTGEASLNMTTIGAVGTTAAKSATITGINWQPGQTLAIRWQDADSSSSDDGLAIDNLTLTAPTGPIEAPGSLLISADSATIDEGAGTITLTVNRVGGTLGTVSADILLTPGSATENDIGTPSVTTITFADGDDTAQTFTVPITNDSVYEIAETFTAGLTNAQGTEGAPTLGLPAKVTIVDNDTPFFSESFEDEPVFDEETGNAYGDGYSLQGPFDSSEPFHYFGRFAGPDLSNGARDDFTGGFDQSWGIQGQFHNGSGFGESVNPTRTVAVADIDISGREDLAAFLSLGAIASEPTHEDWNITDGISIYTTIDSGERFLIGQFKPSGLAGDLKLDTNLDGLGDGVTLHAGTLQDFAFAIPGGGSLLTLEVDVTSTKTFESWALDNVRVDGVQTTTGNTPPEITSDGGEATAGVSIVEGASIVTTVAATDSDAGQTLSYGIANDSGEANEDSALFAINPMTGELSFHTAPDFGAPLDLNMDNVYRVTIVVSDGAGGTDTQELSITVTAAPAPGDVSISDAIVNEADGTVTLTVTRSNGSDGAIDLDFTTVDGSAVAGEDYAGTTGTISFADGETEKTIVVGIANDVLVESVESFSVVLSGVGVSLVDDTSVVTITDNDVYATVESRLTFYNNSYYDTGSFTNGVNGNRAKTNDDAIATDKTALRSGAASFTNYTSYDKGINGIIVDLANVPNPASISASDFLFQNTGRLNSATPVAVTPTSVTTGSGPNGTTRVYITFADGAITKTWLRTTVLASANTNLQSNDVFYFGNAIGESGNSSTDATVNSSDDVNARNNPRNPGQRSADQTKIDLNFDYNRDGLVNSADQVLPRNHATNPGTRLGLITI